jgi:hypothetical protein
MAAVTWRLPISTAHGKSWFDASAATMAAE